MGLNGTKLDLVGLNGTRWDLEVLNGTRTRWAFPPLGLLQDPLRTHVLSLRHLIVAPWTLTMTQATRPGWVSATERPPPSPDP